MPATTPNWFEPKFKAGVRHRLQSQGYLLRGAVMAGSETNGNTVTWKRAAAGAVATVLQSGQSQSPILNLGRDTVQTSFVDYEANDFIKKSDLNKMSENEQQVTMQSIAMAFGRLFDTLNLRNMDNAAGIATIGNGSAAIDITQILNAQNAIFDIGAGSYDYWCALPASWMSQLELNKEFSSADYVGDDYPLLRQIGARRWRGVTFVPMPVSMFNVPSANQADGYLWIRDSIGFEWNQQVSMRADWLPREKGWFIAGDAGCATAVIEPDGIRRLRFATNVALAKPNP